MYDVIILGATYLGAGLAQYYKEKCLVVEAEHRAGYEFHGTLQEFPAGTPKHEAACQLQKMLTEKPGIHESHPAIYPWFQDCQILFGTRVADIQKEEAGFSCTLHGSRGFETYRAKAVIDTRCSDSMCESKTYNFLMESPTLPHFPGTVCTETSVPNRYLVACPLPPDCDFPTARQAMAAVMAQFAPEQRLILSASVFAYTLKAGYPKKEKGILYFPSVLRKTPAEAMDMGLQMGGSL